MHGDISRVLFDPTKQYSTVAYQQGRGDIEADRNAAADIQLHDTRLGRVDMIGQHGAPQGAAGMEITSSGASLLISPGRYYVAGIRAQLDADAPIDFADQPHLPEAALPTEPGLYLLYLDVWERPITAIQDPEIREVALGGPDTTTRRQVIWQVRALPVTTNDPQPHCGTVFAEWDTLVEGPTGTLEIRVAEPADADGPCVVPETAGFTGTANDLFRFQIHTGNFDPTAAGGQAPGEDPSFKWARDNAAIVASWHAHPDTLQVEIDRLGPGGTQGFDIGSWVELTSDHDDLLARAGVFAEIDGATANTLTLVDPPDNSVSTALSPAPQSDTTLHTQARRWDSVGPRDTAAVIGDADVTNDGWIRIIDGLEGRFSAGTYRPGDFWVLPTRTAVLPGTVDRQIEWPVDSLGDPLALRPHGYTHHYARLALADFDGQLWSNVRDCRHLFPPLADLVQMDTRGGDGQSTRSGHWLPAPICVGVSRGETPIVGARIRMQLVGAPGGGLSNVEPDEDGNGATAASVVVETGADGIASGWWQLGPGVELEEDGDLYQPAAAQQVEATLLDSAGDPTNLSTRFVAQVLDNVTLTPAGGDGQFGNPGETLEIAIRVRIANGTTPVEGARVRFASLNRMLDGVNLDEFTGGSIHASANVVEFEPWPGGSRMLEATVETDEDGEAQVQFILGTETGLPVQRVMATLLDADGQPTAQRHLFTAHMSIAGEVTWTPCTHLQPVLQGRTDLQAALDAMCVQIEQLRGFSAFLLGQIIALWNQINDDDGGGGGGGVVFPLPDFTSRTVLDEILRHPGRLLLPTPTPTPAPGPSPTPGPAPGRRRRGLAFPSAVSNAEWVAADGSRRAIGPDEEVPVDRLTRLRLSPGFALPAEVSTGRAWLGLSVYAEEPLRSGEGQPVFGRRPVSLEGAVSVVRGRNPAVVWTPSPGALAWLTERVAAGDGPVALDIEFDPVVLAGAPAAPWSSRFFVVSGN